MHLQIGAENFTILAGSTRDGVFFPNESGEVRLAAPLPEKWNQYAYAVVRLTAHCRRQPKITLEFSAQPGEEALLFLQYKVLPQCDIQIPFPVTPKALAMDFAFLPPWPGVLKGHPGGRPIHPDEVRWMTLVIQEDELQSVQCGGICFQEDWQPQPIQGEALVDELGQRKAGTWPGKTESLAELRDFLTKELDWAKKHNRYPDDWSEYGGWQKKRFPATGWFHRVHDGRRWWLVDPEGCAFFSNGMCYGNRTGIYAMADHLDALYDWMPPREGLFSGARTTGDQIPQYVVRNGLESAKTRELINPARANMMRVFGDEWLDAWITINAARMRSWGINTIGVGVNDYGDEFTAQFLKQAKIPYVITLKFFPSTQENIFRDFPDVFSPEYTQLAKEMGQRELAPLREDPFLIGYFVTNEPEWFFYRNLNLSAQLLSKPGCIASRQAMIAFLKNRHGDIQGLNDAWATDYASFDDLLSPIEHLPDTQSAQEDFQEFNAMLIDQYGRAVSQALREAAPHHLNLGMRYASGASEKTLSGAVTHFDVFSFNRYGRDPLEPAKRLGKATGMPIIVGEWHIGAADSGLDSAALYYAETQALRAQAIRYYLEQSTQAEHLVGIHYFEYNDQPYLGRFDGECYNIGLIDVCNRPYPLVVREFEDFARHMYPLLEGLEQPTCQPVPIWDMSRKQI